MTAKQPLGVSHLHKAQQHQHGKRVHEHTNGLEPHEHSGGMAATSEPYDGDLPYGPLVQEHERVSRKPKEPEEA